ncbi:MAG: isopentenyl phosphate kinase [Anaerolineae bacterium]
MAELVFVKLGGSLITDKSKPMTARQEVIDRCAREIAVAFSAGVKLLLGHGSGSYGHHLASRYGTQQGVHGAAGWEAFARVAQVARELNRLVVAALLAEGLPAVALPPSASARARAGQLLCLEHGVAQQLLQAGALPVVFGDVALDEEWGGTIISTEQVFAYLASYLRPERIVLAGEVDGVCDRAPSEDEWARVYPLINSSNYQDVLQHLGQARGADVTGGMADKVRRMYELAVQQPGLRVHIVNGARPALLQRAILGQAEGEGTVIVA